MLSTPPRDAKNNSNKVRAVGNGATTDASGKEVGAPSQDRSPAAADSSSSCESSVSGDRMDDAPPTLGGPGVEGYSLSPYTLVGADERAGALMRRQYGEVDAILQAARRSRGFFIGAVAEGKTARFLAINHDMMPCDPSKLRNPQKPMAVAFTLLRPLAAGFSKVPFRAGSKVDPKNSKRVSELVMLREEAADPNNNGGGSNGQSPPPSSSSSATMRPGMRMYSFEAGAVNTDKGPRLDDVNWVLEGGNTMLLWLRQDRMIQSARETEKRLGTPEARFMEPLVPPNMTHIDPFSLCEVTIKTRKADKAQAGNGITIGSVKPVQYSLYSCLDSLQWLGATPAAARARQLMCVDRNPCVAKELMTADVPFYVRRVASAAVLDDSDAETMGFVRLRGFAGAENAAAEGEEGGRAAAEPKGEDDGSMPYVVDLPVDMLLRYTNTTRVPWACALLDVAIAVGGLSLLVFSNEYWSRDGGSGHRAIPLIDMAALLPAPVSPLPARRPLGATGLSDLTLVEVREGASTTRVMVSFDLSQKRSIAIDGERYLIRVLVGLEPEVVQSGPAPPCTDLMLLGKETSVATGYAFMFNLENEATHEVIPAVWRGFLNGTVPGNVQELVMDGAAGAGRDDAGARKRRRFQTMCSF